MAVWPVLVAIAGFAAACAGEGPRGSAPEPSVQPATKPEDARERERRNARRPDVPASADETVSYEKRGEWCTRNAEGRAPSECLRELARFPLVGALAEPELPAHTLTEPSVVKRHGEPQSRRTWTTPDPSEPLASLHFLELVYPGFTVVLAGHDEDVNSVHSLRLAAPDVELACGLRVGAPLDRFRESLGSGTPKGEGGIEYALGIHFCTDEGPTYAFYPKLTLKAGSDGAVTSVTWEYAAAE
jgi:hypothetical protein